MESKPPVNPVFVMRLRKTLSACGDTQGKGGDLLVLEKTAFLKGNAEIPVDLSKNREAIEKIKKAHRIEGACDIKALNVHVKERVLGCKNEKGHPQSLLMLSKGHTICTHQPKGSETINIRIMRK